MTYYLLLTRPRFEGQATRYIHICTKSSPDSSDKLPEPPAESLPPQPREHISYPVAHQLYYAEMVARLSAIDPRDSWNNTIVDIYYPTKPDPRSPNNQLALITGYIFVRFADPTKPLSSDILKQSTSNIRYLTIFDHTLTPDPDKPSVKVDVYKPYTMDDHVVRNLGNTLHQNRCSIIQQLVGKKVRIPSGLFMGMQGKIKKISYYPDTSDDAIVLVRVLHDGVFAKTYLSFTLSELS